MTSDAPTLPPQRVSLPRHHLPTQFSCKMATQGFFKVRGKRSDSGPGAPADVMLVLEDAWDGVLNSSIADPPGTIHSTNN
jgi:hypothetical protein